MKKRKRIKVRKSPKKDSSFEKFEEELKEEIEEAEEWMKERKKFLIKLAWVIGFITILLVVSHIYLRTKGLGI